MSTPSQFYAFRHGEEMPRLDYPSLQRLIAGVLKDLDDRGWFQAKLGKDCPDDPCDIGALVLERLGRDLWPLYWAASKEPEPWLFTIIEFAYANVAKPLDSYVHPWDDCGIHVTRSDQRAGQADFLVRINAILGRYEKPFVLRDDGELWEAAPSGLDTLEVEPLGNPSIDDRVSSAVRSFRRYGANEDDKRHAIRDLADVLEYLRSSVGTQLPSKDEADLFNIANNFAIRHHNPQQKGQYSSGVWLDWMFYAFLDSIEASKKLVAKASR